MKLVLIGAGVRGRQWIDFIQSCDDVEIVACVDVDPSVRDSIAVNFGWPTFENVAEVASGVEADGALIATPSLLHGEHAMEALSAGLAVLVEKPLAATFEDAVEVVAAGQRAGLSVMVAENYRFFMAEQTVRKLLDDNAIGNVLSASCVDRRDQPPRAQGAWVKSLKEPFLTEIAVHHFDSFRYFFAAQPKAVWAHTYNPQGSGYDEAGAAEAIVEMDNGLSIQYSGSFVGNRYDYELLICGEKGDIRTNRSKVWMRKDGAASFTEVPLLDLPEGEELRYPPAGMRTLLTHFHRSIEGDFRPETSGEENLWTLAMYDAALRSATSGKFVSIDESFTPELKQRAGLAV